MLTITDNPDPAIKWLIKISAMEAISALFHIELEVLAQSALTPASLIHKTMGAQIFSGAATPRYVHGMITQVVYLQQRHDLFHYSIRLEPTLVLLKQQFVAAVYYQKNAKEMSLQLLKTLNLSCQWQLAKTPQQFDYRLQYNESSLNFLLRLLKDAGLGFYFTFTNDAHQIHFFDTIHFLIKKDFLISDHHQFKCSIDSGGINIKAKTTQLNYGVGLRDKADIITRAQWSVINPVPLTQNKITVLHVVNQFLIKQSCRQSDWLPKNYQKIHQANQLATVLAVKPTQIKIKFLWQTTQQCIWLPLVQQWAGHDHGVQFAPSVGDQVQVGFYQGNPDKPIILGVVKSQSQQKSFGIRSEHHQLIFDHETQPSQFTINSSAAQNITVEKNVYWGVEKTLAEKINGTQSINVTSGNSRIMARQIILKVGASQIKIDNQSIQFSAAAIQLKVKNGIEKSLAVIGSKHKCSKKYADQSPHKGGPIKAGSTNVSINGQGVARLHDQVQCAKSTTQLKQGMTNLLINSLPAAYLGAITQESGVIIEAVEKVSAGKHSAGSTTAQNKQTAVQQLEVDINSMTNTASGDFKYPHQQQQFNNVIENTFVSLLSPATDEEATGEYMFSMVD